MASDSNVMSNVNVLNIDNLADSGAGIPVKKKELEQMLNGTGTVTPAQGDFRHNFKQYFCPIMKLVCWWKYLNE